MKRVMFVGRTGCGKTTLYQAIHNKDIKYKKTQAMNFFSDTIDTPGEYVENVRYYRALNNTSSDCDVIALVHDCTSKVSIFPPGFSSMFSKPVIGIITKIDLCNDEQALKTAENFLVSAGARYIFKVSSMKSEGISALKKWLDIN
ncbi:EutP/PduV family microcompartment system protein [Clostridium sp. AWRP]|uniref:EutP/PduV family microcompartment system protein n=1 Tax=Clostridium sp. AWRP TaxID=2212991 RepID=UPI000FDBD456|nr:EutP/PduV family microcompartment system protein [Clostridium sp. AWRP]AZV58041.1 EutP/PduV family microcompartment system protein [Clostridium sp. AWRP]